MSMKVKGNAPPAEPRKARAEKSASKPVAKKVTINKKAVEAECAKQAQASKKFGSPAEQAALLEGVAKMTEEQAALHTDVQDFHYDPRPHSHNGGYGPHHGGGYHPRPPRPNGPYYPRPNGPGPYGPGPNGPYGPYYPRPNGPGPYEPGPNGPYGPYVPNNPNPPGYILKNRLVTVLENERPAGFSWSRAEWGWALNALRDFPPHRFTTDLDANLRQIWRSYNGSYNQFMAALDNAWY